MKKKPKKQISTTPATAVEHPQQQPTKVEQLANNVSALRSMGIETIAEAEVFCAAATSPDATIGSIVKQLKMPFSTCSRVAWALEQRGLLRYAAHATDRRKKIVSANVERLAS